MGGAQVVKFNAGCPLAVAILAMKWRNRIVQGFSPGLAYEQDRPESTPNPADAGCNSRLEYSILPPASLREALRARPSLRVAGFEDEDEAPPIPAPIQGASFWTFPQG